MGKVYPITFDNAVIAKLSFERDPVLDKPIQIHYEVNAQIAQHDEIPPDIIQYNIQFKTKDTDPIRILIEVSGIFKFTGEDNDLKDNLINEFLNEKAIFILWPIITQNIQIITAQMGMNPFYIPVPVAINFSPIEQ